MTELSLAEVRRLVATANAWRWPDASTADAGGADAERRLDALFGTTRTLAVYGTLAPGEPNHHVVAPLGGVWTDGRVEGDLFPVGWGATLGYPAFVPREGADTIPVKVLTSAALAAVTSAALAADWPRLDRFEGAEYRRILVPVFHPGPAVERRLLTVANLYAAAAVHPGADAG
jgi:gamma-glutamylcyclotransferase (GGCT)/AIG2-like uncharacterized protein YtfP